MTSSVNREIISWARIRSGYTFESLAAELKLDPTEIKMWESGERFPSYLMLEKLAYKYFNIPLALFFFPEPPDIEDTKHKFRRLPEYELSRLSPDTIKIMRFSEGFQESLLELIPPETIKRRIFNDIHIENEDIIHIARRIREYLGITVEQQFKFSGIEAAFKAWRHVLENSGIFTFKNSFKDRFISGFCLLHPQFPIIVINNSNSFSRQIFTLMHELGHIILKVNGITDIEDRYIEYMDEKEKSLEINCNKLASEILVPSDVFKNDIPLKFDLEIVPILAEKYSVSREVILRKFLDNDIISQEYYSSKSFEWNSDFLRGKERKGGDWYLTQLSYLGEGFTRLAFQYYHSGLLSIEQLGQHLNINSKNLGRLEAYMVR
ncbi:MAG: ImmA/IrrE family metallo-endopeptidase [Dehalococcoidales bacterium]